MNTDKYRKAFNELSKRSVLVGFLKEMVFRFAKMDIENHGKGHIVRSVWGGQNKIVIKKGAVLKKPTILIRGNNNYIEFGENVRIDKHCSFYLIGNNTKIVIGQGTSLNVNCHFMNREDNSEIHVGENCMFSYGITLRTSDSHPIFDIETGERINYAKSIMIGDHVWIASNVTVLKGVTIGDGSVVGANSTVTKDVPCNSLSVGMPNRIVKSNIRWRDNFDETGNR